MQFDPNASGAAGAPAPAGPNKTVLIGGGERIGMLGALPPTGSRNAVEKLAQAVLRVKETPVARESLPPALTLSRFNGVLLFGDFLDPIDEIAARLKANGLTQALFNLPPGDWTKGERGLAAIPGREAEFEAARAHIEEQIRIWWVAFWSVAAIIVAHAIVGSHHKMLYPLRQ